MALKVYNTDSYDVQDLPNGYRGLETNLFQRLLTFHGIPILAPGTVDDFAVQEARWVLSQMFQTCEHRINDLRQTNLFVAIMKHIDYGLFDFESESARIILVGDDNLTDRDAETSILIHEVGHAIHNAMCEHEKQHIKALYENRPFWGRDDAYALQNEHEYFAEGVTAYFNAGMPREPVNKRSVLQSFDAPLYSTINAIFERNPFQWLPINQRSILSEHLLADVLKTPQPDIEVYYERR